DEEVANGAQRPPALDDFGEGLDDMMTELRFRQLVDHLACHVEAVALHEVDADEPKPEAQRLIEHVDEHDVAEHVAEVERIDVAARRERSFATALLPIGVEPDEIAVCQREPAFGLIDHHEPHARPNGKHHIVAYLIHDTRYTRITEPAESQDPSVAR